MKKRENFKIIKLDITKTEKIRKLVERFERKNKRIINLTVEKME